MGSSCDFIRTPTQLYRCLHGRQTRIFQFSSTLRGGKRAIEALPLLSWAAEWIFQFSSAQRGGKLEFCGFTAALIGGKMDFPAFLRSERRKTGICSFTAALIGGKVGFPVFHRKIGKLRNCCGYIWRKSFNPIFYHFFPSSACWWVMSRV